jgi:hypothetical protein
MKSVFLLTVVPALLVAMGFAQTPAASGNADQMNVKGCLSGSDGNYTVAEDNTGKIFKITSSGTDLKAYVGQDVNLIAQKGTAENSLAVSALNMISTHCTAAAAVPAAAVSTPAETGSTPPAATAVAPATVAPDASVSTPSETVIERPAAAAPATSAPDATVSTPPPTISTAPAAAAPAATVSSPVETERAPAAAAAVPRTRAAAQPHKPAATPAATPAAAPAPAEPVSTPVSDANKPSSFGPPPGTDSTPAAPATTASTSKSAGKTAVMLVAIIVVVLLVGAGVPLYNRWKRQKLVEETRGQNLSFTKEAKSDPGKSDTSGGRKAA